MGSCFNSRANGYLLGDGLCIRNNRAILRRQQMDKVILKIENDLAEKYKYIVWVGGVDDYYSNYKDAKRDADQWKAKGYDDVIIEKIQKGGAEAG